MRFINQNNPCFNMSQLETAQRKPEALFKPIHAGNNRLISQLAIMMNCINVTTERLTAIY